MKEEYQDLLQKLNKERLPRHIAVILDGNGRWAAARRLPRSAGHKAGVEAVRRLAEICREIGVEYVTVYAFSTENWKRSSDEVGFLMRLFIDNLYGELRTMMDNGVRYGFIGDREALPLGVRQALERCLRDTAQNRDMCLNLAVNYGGRDDITRAVKKLVAQGLAAEEITEQAISEQLDTAGLPDPDLLIRPSGELRVSNFLLWQIAYSEFVFMDKLWPDFGKRDLLQAVLDYQGRERRFGGRLNA